MGITIVVPWRRQIAALPNAAFYQRMTTLAAEHLVHLLVSSHAEVDVGLSNRLTLSRLRLLGERLWGVGGRGINLPVFLVMGIARVLRRYSSSNTVIYTFQGWEALIGIVLSLFGYVWVADILDSPALFHQAAVRYRRQRQWIKAIGLYLFERLVALGLRRARAVLTIGNGENRGLFDDLVKSYHVSPQRIFLLPNGVNLESVQVNSQPTTDRLRLFYVGSVSQERGVDTLLDAVEALSRDDYPIELVLAGPVSDSYQPRLVHRMDHSPALKDSVRIMGRLPHADVMGWMSSSDICLYPFPRGIGLDEVMPIKVLEYLSMGKPVIASDLPGVRRIIRHGDNGVLVEPSNSIEFSRAIAKLRDDKQLREQLGERGRVSASAHSWPGINARFLAIFDSILNVEIGAGSQ